MNTVLIIYLVIPAQGSVKNYHWGKVGPDSYIARFQANAKSLQPNNVNNSSEQQQTTDKPLAELWFSTHPSGSATILVDNHYIKLDEFFVKHPEMVGSIDKYFKYDKKLPFLFKILSVDQTLSLQAHPDKKLAEILHKKDPKNYPDSNHKPEMAIALTEFEILCDFRPYKEILNFMKIISPLKNIVGKTNYENFNKSIECNLDLISKQTALGECFKSLMNCQREEIIRESEELIKQINNKTSVLSKDLERIIVDLYRLYPGDPGIFAPFILNYIKLKPGQAVYLKANKLHAYLKGECIESMACSDNVVRAGLTTKYRDVDTLIKMLNYEAVNNAEELILFGTRDKNDQLLVTYAPTEEFKVDKIEINEKNAPNGEYHLPSLTSGSFIIVLGGKATVNNFFKVNIEHKLSLGSAGFIPPKIKLSLHNIQGTLVMYRAYH